MFAFFHFIGNKFSDINELMIWVKTLNNYTWGMLQSEIYHISHHHVNIMSKLMTTFDTELVEIIRLFSISPVSVFKPCGAKFFSLEIHFSSCYLCAAAVLILFRNMVTSSLPFVLWLWWKYFASSLFSSLFLIL